VTLAPHRRERFEDEEEVAVPTQPYHAVLDELPKSVGLDGYFKRAAIVADHALLQVIWLEPHHPPVPLDQHPFDQTVFVFSGQLELVLGGSDRYVVTAGQCLYIPADVPHQAKVLGDETVHALDIFAPVREDYLPLVQHQLRHEPASPAASGSGR
jgi:mannose-6-phosphate isomerase-like protein (cupin superfamily)